MNLSIKTICLSIAFLCLQAQPASSQQLTKEQAQEKARRFLTSNQVGHTAKKKMHGKAAQLTLASNSEDYFIFNDEQNGGFVIIGGDERQQDVLGYSPDGHFDANSVPDNFQSLLDDYARQTAYLRARPNFVPSATKRVKGVTVSPMLDCTWGQGFPYFNMCPTFYEEHCLTGCVATAFAQIMYYHKWPEKGKGQYSYEWDGQIYSADFSQSTYRWDLMLPTYNENSSKESQDAVALLMKDIGYASMSFYGLGDTGASIQGEQLVNYFDYDQSMRLVPREYCNQEYWDNTIVEELKNSRPIYLIGGSPSGGHSMVIDGCDSEGYYHINFGWDGKDNGFYSLSSIYFNSNQSIVLGIKKNEGGKKAHTFFSKYDFMYLPKEGWMAINVNGFKHYDYNRSNDDYQLGLEVENTATHEVIYCNEHGWYPDFYVDTFLPDGDYKLYPVARVLGGEWQRIVFADNRQEYVDLNVTNARHTYANNNIYDGLQDGAYDIGGIYYFLDFDTHEACVTYKNDKFDGYSGNVTIPGHISFEGTDFTVTSIGTEAFRECDICTLTIPNTVKRIEMSFYDAHVEKIVFEEGSQLEGLGGLCFNAMRTMDQEMNLPEGLTLLPSHIFQSSLMTWCSLPSTLTYISGTPFNYSWNLRYLVANNKNPIELNKDFFLGVDLDICTLYVPKGCVSSYAKAETWKDFGQIKELEDTVTVDGVKYILHDNDLTATVFNAYYVSQPDFELPSEIEHKGKTYQVTEIGPFAFTTRQFGTLTIPSSVKYFGEGCLYDYSFNILPQKLILYSQEPPEVADMRYAGKEGFKPFFFFESLLDWVYSSLELHVPVGSKAKYEAHTTWGRLKNIVEDVQMGVGDITSKSASPNRQAVYTLSGVKLNTTDTNSLSKGIYIRNGKKVVIE